MTTLNLQVGASADDAHETDGNTEFDATNVQIKMNDAPDPEERFNGGMRYTSVTVPSAATIDAATTTLEISGTSTDSPQVDIFGEDVDNAVDFSTTADVTDRTRTAASVSWVDTNIGNGPKTSPDFKAVIQEIVDRGGWGSGNAIVILIDGKDQVEVEQFKPLSYDFASSTAPKLDIDYTAGGGGGGGLPERSYPRGMGRGTMRGVA